MTQWWVSEEGGVNWGRVQRGGEHDQNVLYDFSLLVSICCKEKVL